MGHSDSAEASSMSPNVALSDDYAASGGGGGGVPSSSVRDEEKRAAAEEAAAHDHSSDDSDDESTEVDLGRIRTAVSLGAVPGSIAAGIEAGPPPETSSRSSAAADAAAAAAADPERLSRVASGPVYSVFSKRTKMYIISLVTVTAFISPMTANVYFPALPALAADMGVSLGMINLTLTTYMIFQGIAPALFGNFGDMAGRRPAVLLALTIYLFVNIGLALQNSFAALLVLRMFQSFGSSGTLALGYAVVADISVSAERGKYMSIVNVGINVGPALSPVIGGILAEFLGWRAIFWFCCILAGCVLVPYALTLPETCRAVVGNGSLPPPPINRTVIDLVRRWRRRRHQRRLHKQGGGGGGGGPNGPDGALAHTTTADTTASAAAARRGNTRLHFPNPLRTLVILFEKDLALALFSSATTYVVSSVCVTTLSSIFDKLYGLNELQVGLCFLPYGAGCCIASAVQGYLLDWNYRRTAKRIGFAIDYKRGDDLSHFPIERARLEVLAPMLVGGVVVVIGYGWALQYAAPLAVSLVLLFFVGLTVVGAFSLLNTFIMDLYPQAPATAVAANNMVRCLLGAGVMAFIQAMFDRLGHGWTFTFWALVMAVLLPVLWVLGRWGPTWREERRLRLEAKAARHRAHEEEKKKKKKRRRDEAAAHNDAPPASEDDTA